ncbi:glycoprotein-N-acetylgalactosamine 3-beta-galactosyltransferase 1-like [Gigantopelta aegis]|uniref:glycoprotein-N-acetylgalactosamine 3-beta-galactosyltransferase 1-like n=1 Tax=Gigantopelta aegis TaxID=1735272 RepID=UPI001B889463|nr:glycoprotein-N-acetylgalactosamine 3-beta-galactosyltransferase 1-like [Gigantopelta aegis]
MSSKLNFFVALVFGSVMILAFLTYLTGTSQSIKITDLERDIIHGQTEHDFFDGGHDSPKYDVMEDDSNVGLALDTKLAEAISKNIKVACFITTMQNQLDHKLRAVNQTWGRRCDKILYVMTTNMTGADILPVEIEDDRQTLTEKTRFAFTHLYNKYLNQFDFFLKADDDTYIIMENLKYLLSHYNASQPIYMGDLFIHFAPNGYMSGGASYVLSREALKRLVENGYKVPGRCRLEGGAEDIETGRCLYKADVLSYSPVDRHGRKAFHAHNAYSYIVGPMPGFLNTYSRIPPKVGDDCCSQLTISFHYTGPKLMYLLDFLLYKISVFGRSMSYKKLKGLFQLRELTLPPTDLRRRAYPGEQIKQYYNNETDWRKLNTTIYVSDDLKRLWEKRKTREINV